MREGTGTSGGGARWPRKEREDKEQTNNRHVATKNLRIGPLSPVKRIYVKLPF